MSLPTLIPIAVGVLGLLIWALPKKFWLAAIPLLLVAGFALSMTPEEMERRVQNEMDKIKVEEEVRKRLTEQETVESVHRDFQNTRLSPGCRQRKNLLGQHADKGWSSLATHAHAHAVWGDRSKKPDAFGVHYLAPWCGPLIQALIVDHDEMVDGIERLYLFFRIDRMTHEMFENSLPFKMSDRNDEWIEYPAKLTQNGTMVDVTFRVYHGSRQMVLVNELHLEQTAFTVYFKTLFSGRNIQQLTLTGPIQKTTSQGQRLSGSPRMIRLFPRSEYATYNFFHPDRLDEGTAHRL